MSYENDILDAIEKRNITRLCHITRSEKALHILSSVKGIEAVNYLDKALYDPNDINRYDGHLSHINCSIEYPNHWYLDKIKDKNNIFKDWVVLLINPAVMTNRNTKFCCINAANNRGENISSGYEAFEGLFCHKVLERRRYTSMLACCPTDGQAEVLIYKNILPEDIYGIIVKNEQQAIDEYNKWDLIKGLSKVDIYIAPDIFTNNWYKQAVNGKRVKEKLFYSEKK